MIFVDRFGGDGGKVALALLRPPVPGETPGLQPGRPSDRPPKNTSSLKSRKSQSWHLHRQYRIDPYRSRRKIVFFFRHAVDWRPMAKKSRFKLPPLHHGGETIGQRLARLRKAKGLTQVALAKKIGIIQTLVSEYELDKLRLHAEMLMRFALALEVSADEILGLKPTEGKTVKASFRMLERLEKIQKLTPTPRKALLKTIDMYLSAAEGKPR